MASIADIDRLENEKNISSICRETSHDSSVLQPSRYQLSYPDRTSEY